MVVGGGEELAVVGFGSWLYYYKNWMQLWVLCVVVMVVVLRTTVVLWWRPRKIEAHFAKQGIRGPPYRFFLGNVKELVELMLKASSQPMPNLSHNILPRVFSFYHHWKKIYGATFVVWFGPTARVTVSDPELIREIFSSKSENYEKIEANPMLKQLEGDGLISLKGEKWAHHRKIITPTFHMENLKLLIPSVARSVEEMLLELQKEEEENKKKKKNKEKEKELLLLLDHDEFEIDVSEWFQGLSEDVITRMAFGNSFFEQGRAIFGLQNQLMVLASDAFQKVLIPGYRFLPTVRNIRTWRLVKEIRRSLVKMIQQRKTKLLEMNELGINVQHHHQGRRPILDQSAGPKDLLGLMIQASFADQPAAAESGGPFPSPSPSIQSMMHHQQQHMNITVQDIVEECKSFFFAGKQTTSNLLTWTTVLLAMHPQWQDLARDEVIRVCGGGGGDGSRDYLPTKDDILKLKTLTMILNESLRLYPPVIATIRRAKRDVELGGYKVPQGTELLVPILAVHHDQAMWGQDANDFNPARFSDGASRAARHPAAFIPFGLGMRSCVGQNLALIQAKLVLSMLLQRFSFRLSPSYKHAPTVLMLLYPQHGAPVIFRHIHYQHHHHHT